MTARLTLSIPLLFCATFAAGFAPAPVYKQPPKPTYSSLQRAMQGTWSRSLNTKAKGPRASRIRIEGKIWTTRSPTPRAGGGTGGIQYEIHLDISRTPPALDLVRTTTSRVMMRGIVKVDGDRLIFCYARGGDEADRPKAFTDTETESGQRVMTMTLTRVEESATSP